MRRLLECLIVIGLMLTSASPSRSSVEWPFEAFQPMWTPNGIVPSRVTVMTHNTGAVGLLAVFATCDSNQVMTDLGPQQRNAAFDAGLKVEVTPNSDRTPLFGDTLCVILRATKPPGAVKDFAFGSILAASVQCVLANAAQWKSIRFVAIRVEGAEGFRNYGGVYATSRFRRSRVFREP